MISLVVVNYRSAALATEAIRSARLASSGPLQVIIVDNSCDAGEAAALAPFADDLIVPDRNLGYGGAINRARRACKGSVIVVSNADVVFASQAIDRLADAVRAGAAVAGPAFFWDAAHRWHFPPADLTTALEKTDEILASRSARWSAARARRRFQRRLRFWSVRESQEARMLSGAVLAIASNDFDAIGGFDERFRLYFEESDFLRRISERRRRIMYVPAARCRHLYSQSVARDAERAAQLYAESERLYLEKWNGPALARVLKLLERPMIADDHDLPMLPAVIPVLQPRVVIEASPMATFATAAGRFADPPGVTIPEEVLAAFVPTALYVRAVTLEGRVLSTYVRRA